MEITAKELKERISLNDEKLIIVDVREDWEFEEYRIAHINIPLYSIPNRIDEFKAMSDKKVVIHCNTGKRSNQAKKFLTKQGITNIVDLTGGLESYLQA